MDGKKCFRCLEVKPESEYYKKRNGLMAQCKSCYGDACRSYRKDNIVRIREHDRRRAEAVKYDVMSHYSSTAYPQCSCCGEENITFLAIDHTDGGGSRMRREGTHKTGYMMYKYLKKNNYPDGFQVLCHNCNWGKHHHGVCPHESEVSSVMSHDKYPV